YSLFVTSRFREELQRGDDVPTALARTMATAGRAVFFSGLTVLIGLGALVTFDFMFLRSVGIAGIIVVGISLLAALTLLPAILVIIGRRIERFRLFRIPGDNLSHHGFWSILSRWVMARPVLVLVPTLLVLIVLGEPFRHVNISSPDATILPAHTTSRQGYDQLVTAFGPGEISPMVLVFQSPTSMFADENALAIRKIVRTLEEDPRVSRADGFMAFGAGTDDDQALGLLKVQERAMALGFAGRFAQFAQPNTALVLVYLTTFPNDPASKAILRDIRANQPGGDVTLLVDGGTAEIVDVVAEMYGNFPLAIGIVVIATYLILFLLFHSVILPIKAILMNMLSLIASYGALVWIFQDGHLANLLRFQPQGYV
ncbi:MAG TPA: MMPL family transporter, partial [Thermomicrobiales bacterium]|nr:MMPL family transporter [Thermomicrobiales bacterium]